MRMLTPRLLRVGFLVCACMLATPALASAKTVVSLTFDDGNVEQATVAQPILAAHGMVGTFYVNSALIGQTDKMSWDQVRALASAGNEIGGHTLHHVDLTQLSTADATTEVCQDRQNITAQGITPTDFAYPFGAYNATVEGIVKSCGYDSARVIGNLQTQTSCQSCLAANAIPPADPYAVATNSSIKASTPLSTIEWDVTNAESQGGGWVPLVFHHICVQGQNVQGTSEPCDTTYSIDPSTFSAFLDWLQGQSVQVETAHQVMTTPPPTPGPNLLQNASLETVTSGRPACFQTRNSNASFTATYAPVSSPVHSGAVAEQANTSSFTGSLGPQVYTTQDTGTCAPHVTAGHFYTGSIWYESAAPVFLNVYYHDSAGWHYWKSSVQLASSSSWAQARYTTPAVPSGADLLSIGLEGKGTGLMTVDDYYLYDTAV